MIRAFTLDCSTNGDTERSNTMYTRILVPLDGSTRAERAIPVAARIARTSGGAVVLVRAVNVAFGFLPSLVGEAPVVQSVLAADQAAADAYPAGIKQVPEPADITTTTTLTLRPPDSST